MNALGSILLGIQLGFLLLAAILIGGSFGGFLGGGYMIVAAILVIVLWGVFAGLMVNSVRLAYLYGTGRGSQSDALTWANWLFITAIALSALTGLGFAFLSFVGCGPLYVPSLYHWGGMIGTILGFLSFFLLPAIVRACVEGSSDSTYPAYHNWGWVLSMPLLVTIIWGLVWLIPYLQLKGDIAKGDYLAANHIYKLPFPGGESSWVIQGNNSSKNHNTEHNNQKFAWDFRRRCSTPVLAARDGNIGSVTDGYDGIGDNNNQITVNHNGKDGKPDGTVAYYLHIRQGSVPSKFRPKKDGPAIPVHQGDQIAEVGCVGKSLTGHIHFMVKVGNSSIGVSFVDVSDDDGVPRTFGTYTSGNRKVQ